MVVTVVGSRGGCADSVCSSCAALAVVDRGRRECSIAMPRNDRSSVTLGALEVGMIRDTNGSGCEMDFDRSFLDNQEIE